jgi:putative tricarboxylic transport membrane protein
MRSASRSAAVVALGVSAAYLVAAARLPRGTAHEPGAGLVPLLVGLLLVGASLAYVWQARGAAGETGQPVTVARGGPLGLVAALAAFCLVLPWLGYLVTAFGLLAVVVRLYGLRAWGRTLLVAVVATLASHYLFAGLLGVPLPPAPWSR